MALPIAVLRNRKLSMSAKVTFAIVLSYAWGDNPCFASVERMAKEAGISRTACYDGLKELRAAALVEVTREQVAGRMRRTFRPVAAPIDIPDSGREKSGGPEIRNPDARKGSKEGLEVDASLAEAREKPRPVKFDGRVVPEPLVARAVETFAYYCMVTSQARTPFRSDGRPSEDLKRVLGRVVENPELEVERLREIVDHVIANPPSFVKGKVMVGHIFGPSAFSWSLANDGLPGDGSFAKTGRGALVEALFRRAVSEDES